MRALREWKQKENSEFKRPFGAKATEIACEWSEEGDLRAVRALRAWKQKENSEFKRPWGAKALEDAGAARSWSVWRATTV